MAFRRLSHANRKLQMVSLIDLIFILLIFFIITSILIKLVRGESQLFIPTPKNEPGEAQILIQILDKDNYLWIDHTAIDTLNFYTYKFTGNISHAKKANILLEKMSFDSTGFYERIESLKKMSAAQPHKEFFVLIRCPEEMPYYYATNIIERLIDVPNLEYGCLAGSIDDVLTKGRISVHRNTIQIDFQ